jgi:hypothetical protein
LLLLVVVVAFLGYGFLEAGGRVARDFFGFFDVFDFLDLPARSTASTRTSPPSFQYRAQT